ncbi:hypothetical protein BGZ61DRAFT_68368 [Ilyonectria robusta]|uniref:uncharacterized protein n=1 Tax=Ilyonectria robusta TaxID=1079257 RepID=UPI001E8E9337|nr:uncharacterized protein BGZ61DRAFT_68368 [Ilyonectria robusta]KAH8679154.1 hypothetical protein BGZ61DRAFT_68368 [Ilyonectria robusta]
MHTDRHTVARLSSPTRRRPTRWLSVRHYTTPFSPAAELPRLTSRHPGAFCFVSTRMEGPPTGGWRQDAVGLNRSTPPKMLQRPVRILRAWLEIGSEARAVTSLSPAQTLAIYCDCPFPSLARLHRRDHVPTGKGTTRGHGQELSWARCIRTASVLSRPSTGSVRRRWRVRFGFRLLRPWRMRRTVAATSEQASLHSLQLP